MFTLLLKGVKKFRNFLIEDFFDLPPVVHIKLRISPRISKNSKRSQVGYSGAWEKLIHEKT
jgi:hypothetical protein